MACISALACTGLVMPASGQGISVSPSRFFFTGNPGDRVSQVLRVENPSDQRTVFKVSLKDFERDSLGEKVYSEASDNPGSNAKWVEMLPDIIELGPREKKEIMIHLQIPYTKALSQQGVSRSMLFLSQINEQPAVQGQSGGRNLGIQVKLEIGIHIYYTPAHCTRRSLEFLAFEDRGPIQSGKDTLRRFAISIKNDGDVSTDASVRLELTDKATGAEMPIPEKRITMLPGARQIVYMDLPALKGHYLAIAMLDTGDQNDLKVAEKDVIY
jgi:hypothetical protein